MFVAQHAHHWGLHLEFADVPQFLGGFLTVIYVFACFASYTFPTDAHKSIKFYLQSTISHPEASHSALHNHKEKPTDPSRESQTFGWECISAEATGSWCAAIVLLFVPACLFMHPLLFSFFFTARFRVRACSRAFIIARPAMAARPCGSLCTCLESVARSR